MMNKKNKIRVDGIDYDVSYIEDDLDFKSIDYNRVYERKICILNKLKKDESLLREVKKYYRHNPIAFIEDWVETYDPRAEIKTMPFILFKKQKEYINWLIDRVDNEEDGIVEKSRGVGVTHLSVAFGIWMYLFLNEVTIGFSSRKMTLADNLGNPDSLLEKGRMFIRRIPKIFLPKDFSIEKNCLYARFINNENGSRIIAEGGDNIGRGGRCTAYFPDEAAFYERPERVEAALSQTSRSKIFISSVNGTSNPFYTKRVSGRYPVFIFDWKDDPRNSQEWYEEQKAKYGDVIVARELDRDYEAGGESACIPLQWIKKSIVNFSFDEINNLASSYPIIAGLDVADEGADRNAIVIRRGAYLIDVFSWKEGNLMNTASKAYDIAVKYGVHILNYDGHGIGGGLKGQFERLMNGNDSFKINNVKVGSPAPDGNDSNAKFKNLKAYLWMSVRERFRKVYEKDFNDETKNNELIYIKNHHDLILELSTPSYNFSDTGLLQIESKDKLKKRGVKSPDLADAFMLAYYFKQIKYSEFRMI